MISTTTENETLKRGLLERLDADSAPKVVSSNLSVAAI
jgi:hypothetical protein